MLQVGAVFDVSVCKQMKTHVLTIQLCRWKLLSWTVECMTGYVCHTSPPEQVMDGWPVSDLSIYRIHGSFVNSEWQRAISSVNKTVSMSTHRLHSLDFIRGLLLFIMMSRSVCSCNVQKKLLPRKSTIRNCSASIVGLYREHSLARARSRKHSLACDAVYTTKYLLATPSVQTFRTRKIFNVLRRKPNWTLSQTVHFTPVQQVMNWFGQVYRISLFFYRSCVWQCAISGRR